MDQTRRHRELIEDLLREYTSYKPSYGEIEVETIVDAVKGHYQLVNVGWHGQRRIYGCILHIDVKDGKIWIQWDGTEEGFANRLVAAGVPKNEIVLGFQSPFQRRHTEFAVG
jgi:hypothetical protein